MADTDVRPQLSSWCRSDDHPGCKSVQARCRCSCHGVNGQEPPVNRPPTAAGDAKTATDDFLAGNGNRDAIRRKRSSIQTSPSAGQARRVAEEIAETADDALGIAIGHLRWHRDHLAARLAKIDAALAALEDLGGEA